MAEDMIETRKVRWPKRLFFILVCITLAFLYIHKIEPSWITTKEFAVKNESIPTSFNGFKIAHVSDIHFGRTTNEKEITKMVEKINEMKPDLVVFSGDLFDSYITLSQNNIDFLSTELQKIHSTLGNYAILGDSDYAEKEAFQNIMENANFTILNHNIPIYYKGNTPVYLAGYSSSDPMDTTILQKQSYQIVICHEPSNFDTLKSNASLVLAGHSLGGLIRLPFTNGLLKKENTNNYILGKYEEQNSILFVSSGIGTEEISMRFLNPPTINLYRLYSK